jgi:carboxymethylenebutenolidase
MQHANVGHPAFCRQVRVKSRPLVKTVVLMSCFCASVLMLSGWSVAAAAKPPQGASVDTSTVTYDSGGANISAYLAKPNDGGKHRAVIVVHDNQGLTDEVRNAAQKLAAEGFVALAPDLLSRKGGTKAPDQAAAAVRELAPMDTVADLQAAFAYLQKSSDVDSGKISAVGFGWGGWRSFMLASATPTLYRVVIYSGATPVDTAGLQSIRTPVLGNYGQYDFQNAGDTIWTSKTMRQLGKQYTPYIYPKVQAGFYNSKSRQYDGDAAKTAWTRTLDFLKS